MTAITYAQLALDWSPQSKTSRQFLLLSVIVVLLMMLAGVWMSMIKVPEPERQAIVNVPERIANFILQKPKPKPRPKPVTKPKPKPKPEPKKVDKPKVKKPPKKEIKKALTQPQKKAREKAQKSGLLALADQLDDLMDTSEASELLGGSIKSSSAAAKQAGKGNQGLLLADAGKGSGGVNETVFTTQIARKSTLSQREITQVRQSLLASDKFAKLDASKSAPAGKSKKAHTTGVRGEEEITIVFYQNKSKLFSFYNRARRKNPSLKGRIVFQLTVSPGGDVTRIIIVSSELNDAKLESRLLTRIKQFKFGAKKVEEITITYPIEFLPG